VKRVDDLTVSELRERLALNLPVSGAEFEAVRSLVAAVARADRRSREAQGATR
jgi:hypothetical protein